VRAPTLPPVVDDPPGPHGGGQPVLVGTTSVEKSEQLSALLSERKIPHQVLNAKQHAREAAVVAMAGRKGAVTVATNMAGRGTDIMLGGNAEHIAVSGLKEAGLDPEENAEEYDKAWPAALRADSITADCAFVRNSTAISLAGRPSLFIKSRMSSAIPCA